MEWKELRELTVRGRVGSTKANERLFHGAFKGECEENGNGNIHFPSAIRALSAGVEKLMRAS